MRMGKTFKSLAMGITISLFGVSSVFANVIGVATEDNVKAYSAPSVEQASIAVLDKNESVLVFGVGEGWVQIALADGKSMFVPGEYITIKEVEGTVIQDNINIRKYPSADAEILGKLNKDDKITMIGRSDNWCVFEYNGVQAFIYGEYVEANLVELLPEIQVLETVSAAEEKQIAIGVVNATNLNLRSGPSTSTSSLRLMPFGTTFEVLEYQGDWAKIKTDDGVQGFVSTQFISLRKGELTSRSNRAKGEDIVAYAMQFLGTPYRWAGNDLRKGVDCSGFTSQVMKAFGITISRSSRDQAQNGVRVTKAELMPGDLVFFDTTNRTNRGYISHAAIYMGDGKIIHSSSGKQWGVTINSLSEDYYASRYVTAVRVVR